MLKENGQLKNQLKSTRTRLGLSQQDLAASAGVARQTIGGIEAEMYAPSAVVALRLARSLGCRVEEIFWLEEESAVIEACPPHELLAGTDHRVSLARISNRWIAHSLDGDTAFRTEMAPADGVGGYGEDGTFEVRLLDEADAIARTVVVAGCTPALSLWTRASERWFPGLRVHTIHANSMEALARLARGEVHIAGLHLFDANTGQFNHSFVRAQLPDRAVSLVNFGFWNEGLVVSAGNPKTIGDVVDLVRPDVTMVNRESGAGSRVLLDVLLARQNLPPSIRGYDDVVRSHQAIGQAVAQGRADVGISTAAIAAVYGLDFVPLKQVRYDLALLTESLDLEPVRQLLSTLQHRWVRNQLSILGGHNTSASGDIEPVMMG